MLEAIVNLFYVPWIFWGVPFVLAAVIELVRLRRRRRRRTK